MNIDRNMQGIPLAGLVWISLWLMLTGLHSTAWSATPDMEAELLRGIEINYAGDHDRALSVFKELEKAAPDHPAGAFYQTSVLFWKNSLDPNNPRFDEEIQTLLERAISLSRKRLEKQPKDLEALHYMGLAYTYLGRMDAHRGRLYAGGVKGETGRKYLEKAMQLSPCLGPPQETRAVETSLVCEDIQFPYGAYVYFAGRLPRLLRLFDFLWFIPQGASDVGMAALERARQKSRLHHLGATQLLVNIYAYLEPGKTGEALALSTELVRRFPDNPTFDLQQARLLLLNGKYEEAYAQSQAILNKVKAARPNYDDWVFNGTRLIISEIDIHKGHIQTSITALADIEATATPEINAVFSPQVQLLKGMIEDLRGLRQEALRYYKAVLNQQERFRNRIAEKEAQRRIEKAFSLGLPQP